MDRDGWNSMSSTVFAIRRRSGQSWIFFAHSKWLKVYKESSSRKCFFACSMKHKSGRVRPLGPAATSGHVPLVERTMQARVQLGRQRTFSIDPENPDCIRFRLYYHRSLQVSIKFSVLWSVWEAFTPLQDRANMSRLWSKEANEIMNWISNYFFGFGIFRKNAKFGKQSLTLCTDLYMCSFLFLKIVAKFRQISSKLRIHRANVARFVLFENSFMNSNIVGRILL